jgi:1-acyl-sn-glycerol-3-phosphate acyltransferase
MRGNTLLEDWFYRIIVFVGRFPFLVSSSPVILHAERTPRTGAFILASSHLSAYDVPVLMRSTPRVLDFVSTVEVFSRPALRWFYGHMGAFPLDRRRPDPRTVKIILDRLARGRVVAIFPEGMIRPEQESVIHGGVVRPGTARLARLAGVPIVPAVVWGASAYSSFTSWFPFRRTHYGVIYGEPIEASGDERDAELRLSRAYKDLYSELRRAMDQRAGGEAPR